MTSKVKITACCSDDKEVLVQRWNKDEEKEFVLNNGQEIDLDIYDGYKVYCIERLKDNTPNPDQLELF